MIRLLLTLPVFLQANPAPDAPHVVFLVGEPEYRSEETMPALAALLRSEYGMRTTVLHDRSRANRADNSIEGLEALEGADLAVLYLGSRRLPAEQLARIEAYVRSGRPLVGFRTALRAFEYELDDPLAAKWNAFGPDVLGAAWVRDYSADTGTAASVARESSSPILKGLARSFDVRSWMVHVSPKYPPKEAEILATGRPTFPDGRWGDDATVNPVAWTLANPWGGGRVFTTTMGHPEDFKDENFLRLVVGGVHWALDLPNPRSSPPPMARVKQRGGLPWQQMDYGPFLATVIEIDPEDIVCKGLAIPVEWVSPEGVHRAVVFDTDLGRWAAGWWGGFLDLRGIVYDGEHGVHSRIDGTVEWQNPALPGWSLDGKFVDPRAVPYGPLPAEMYRWEGHSRSGNDVILRYRVGTASIQEQPWFHRPTHSYVRSLEIGPCAHELFLKVAAPPGGVVKRIQEFEASDASTVFVGLGTEIYASRGLMLLVAYKGDLEGVRWLRAESGGLDLAIAPSDVTRRIDIFLSLHEAEGEALDSTFFQLGTARLARAPSSRTSVTPTLWGEPTELAVRSVDESAGSIQYRALSAPADGPARTEVLRSDARLRWELAAVDAGEPGAAARTYAIGRPLTAPSIAEGGPKPVFVADESTHALEFSTGERILITGIADFEFKDGDLTFAAWVKPSKDGTLFSQTAAEGPWVPDGKAFFVRDGRLCFDVGWVGDVNGRANVVDGRWHHVALVWRHESSEVELWVDGGLDGEGVLAPKARTHDHVAQLGFTAEDFPEEPWFAGVMNGVRIFRSALTEDEVLGVASETGAPAIHVVAFLDRSGRARWRARAEGVALELPPGAEGMLVRWRGLASRTPDFLRDVGLVQDESAPFDIDRITWPESHASLSWMRFGDFDFFADDSRAAITTWSGDVWTVAGLRPGAREITWQRMATGLHQPLGLVVKDDDVYVLGRDQITRLVDRDGDGEADDYEAFSHGQMNSEHFHEPCTGLQVDAAGNFYYMKGARHALEAVHPRNGTLNRVSADGSRTETIAGGFRAPNGLLLDGDGVFWGSDQEGQWMPANKLNRIVAGGFYGNNWALFNQERHATFDPPLCWISPKIDRSPSAQLRVPAGVWGDLAGKLLALSYGTGRVFLVLEEKARGVWQGGITPLPIELPTGLMRGRFQKSSGDLYLCGLFGWSSDKQEPGGFYRVRRTGAELPHVQGIEAVRDGLVLRFNTPLAPDSVKRAGAFTVSAWNYEWTVSYGSPDIALDGTEGRTQLTVEGVELAPDARSVRLKLTNMQPAMQFHTEIDVETASGTRLETFVHHTVHALGE